MAEEAKSDGSEAVAAVAESGGSKTMIRAVAAVLALVLVGTVIFYIMTRNKEPEAPVVEKFVEYVMAENLYQLKEGSILRLGFSIVVPEKNLEALTNFLEVEAAAILPSLINLNLGDKGRDDLIAGEHKRKAFQEELKNLLESEILPEYNRRQDPLNQIHIREVRLKTIITQEG